MIFDINVDFFYIISDFGCPIRCSKNNCKNIDGNSWTVKEYKVFAGKNNIGVKLGY